MATCIASSQRKMADFEITGGGTVYILTPCTTEAKEWLEEHVDLDNVQWFGRGIAVEHRYIEDIVEGARGDGLEVSTP